MALGNRQKNSRPTAKTRSVKTEMPEVSKSDLQRNLRKTETLNFRLTPAEKESLRRAASELGMSVSEYMLRCHDVISRKLGLE